jgi:hypothetical protein
MSNRGGEARALVKRSKGCCIHLHAPYSSCIMPSTSKDMATKSKMGHMITVGLSMLGFKGETRQTGQSRLEQPE